MRVAAIQADLIWGDGSANRMNFESVIEHLTDVDLVVMPEMFTTGFYTQPEGVAEKAQTDTLEWLKETSARKGFALAGSVAVEEDGKYFNRFYFVQPNGQWTKYDKRHAFTFGGEHLHYTGGTERVVVEYMGWKILLQVCYDLRFPVFSRNLGDYDMALYVASWPVPRIGVWDTLLKGRAIENLAYVIGCNRVGNDPACEYNGSSAIIDFKGEPMTETTTGQEAVLRATLDKSELEAFRAKFPALNDADKFKIEI